MILGLGLSAITGSKLSIQVLNRQGHCINYSEVKALETEFAFSVVQDGREAPDGIKLVSHVNTACVWDNNDANIETLDGKATTHATVGHTYQNVCEEGAERTVDFEFRSGRNRRKFVGIDRDIPVFRKSLSSAIISLPLIQADETSTSTAPSSSSLVASSINRELQLSSCCTAT